jgi:hypothetical protein
MKRLIALMIMLGVIAFGAGIKIGSAHSTPPNAVKIVKGATTAFGCNSAVCPQNEIRQFSNYLGCFADVPCNGPQSVGCSKSVYYCILSQVYITRGTCTCLYEGL